MRVVFQVLILLVNVPQVYSQSEPVRFVHISDTHIGSPNGSAEEDLKRTIEDLNGRADIDFVVITGDITELGTNQELALARSLFDRIRVPWFIVPGNHDTGWSESGGQQIVSVFGYDKFVFTRKGVQFIGCASGPYLRMSDGHVPRDALLWMDSVLSVTGQLMPLVFFNHYPLDPGLDNWYEVTDRLKRKNILFAVCGHGHVNKKMNFEGIPAFMGRSNLRTRTGTGGYNIVEIRNDSVLYTEVRPGTSYQNTWASLSLKEEGKGKFHERPDFSINEKYPSVKVAWVFRSNSNVISTPLVTRGYVIFGNMEGTIESLSLDSGISKWKIRSEGGIFSSPAAYNENFILGSAGGHIDCYRVETGERVWTYKTAGAVLGSPLIYDGKVYIGASDKKVRAIDAESGKLIWSYDSLEGPVVSRPVQSGDRIILGAWDRHLYALGIKTGELSWKWDNGSPIRNYSPAACLPVIADNKVFVVAPDRYISAIDLQSGNTLWRNNDAVVRESIGISANNRIIYVKTMQDTIAAYRVSGTRQYAVWKMHVGFGYEHVPSMLVEKNGLLYFGTRNGVVYCINTVSRKIRWAYKIDNSMVNTVFVTENDSVIAATMDGSVILLREEPGK